MNSFLKLLEKYYDTEDNTKIRETLFKKFGTNKKCCKCSSPLLISDLKEYEYLCLNCEENFYNFEI